MMKRWKAARSRRSETTASNRPRQMVSPLSRVPTRLLRKCAAHGSGAGLHLCLIAVARPTLAWSFSGMSSRRKLRRSPRRHVSAAQRVINQWRGIAEPAEGVRPGRPVADLVPEALNRLRMRSSFTEEEICAAWGEIVGPVLAPHTRPSGLRRGVLLVSVVQPTVHYTIQGMKQLLLERLQERFGATRVQDLRFRLGS